MSTNPFSLPVLQRHKWKCRSAPELRGSAGRREDPLRRLSYLDLPFSFSYRPDGRQLLMLDARENEDSAPSLLWGDEAYRHYKLLTLIEMKEKLQQIQSAKTEVIKKYMWKQEVMQNLVDVAKAYYSNPTKENRDRWKQLRAEIHQSRNHSITDIQYSLAHIPHYEPIFTVLIIAAHVLSLIIMCAVSTVGPAGLLSEKETAHEVPTFMGTETVHRYITPNPWIGPPVTTLLASGASFGLCLRQDKRLEEEGKRRHFSRLDQTVFGCCQVRGSGLVSAAGTTTRDECRNYTNNVGVWSPPPCSHLAAPAANNVSRVIGPCCVDHRATCLMLSSHHCSFLGGIFHPDRDHCVQVLCVRDVCKIGKNLSQIHPNPGRPWLPKGDTVWQWWRLLLSLIYTWGFMHCLALVALEWLLMKPLEQSAGWFRVMLVYSLCGVAGQIVACTAQPYVPHVGSTSGVAGVIGEAAVELSWAWTLLENPRREVLKLAAFFTALMVLGLLPYISLLGSLAGCGCGAGCAFIFMNYLTYDRMGQCQKAILTTCAVVGLLIFYIVLLYTFIVLQPPPCQACRSLECLPLADNMCNQWDLLG